MRDIVLTGFIFASLPFILRRPWLGILMPTWIGLMNPHRLTWGFAYDMPFAIAVALLTLLAIMFSREPKSFPVMPATVILLLFMFWMTVTSLFPLYPETVWVRWEKVFKVLFFILVTMAVMQTRERILWLTWVATMSIAFFGIKGGIFTLITGGQFKVLGPDGSFIAGNTEIALAITMVIPMMRYLQMNSVSRWVRRGLGAGMGLCALSVLGSQSRGGLLAVAVMGVFLWLKSPKKLAIGLGLLLLVPMLLLFMPATWYEKMDTIGSYQEDSSATGRINSWTMGFNLAKDRPLTGGGFLAFNNQSFQRWAPNPLDVHDAHSIWFHILGEHGFVGLAIFLALWLAAWRLANGIMGMCKDRTDLLWARDLAAMTQVSFLGYWVGGSFLSLAYFDLPYVYLAILVLTKVVVNRELGMQSERSSARPIRASPSALLRPGSGAARNG